MHWYRPFLFNIRVSIRQLFSFPALYIHLLAIFLTLGIVLAGLDWRYYQFAHSLPVSLWLLALSAGAIGFFVPLFLPLILLVSKRTRTLGCALVQSISIAWLLSAFYKALTGREHPVMAAGLQSTDITRVFEFGILRGGVFWGWPSSHATVACALAATVFVMVKRLWVRVLAVLFGAYIAIGASLTFHWLSDAVAGVLFGTLVGVIVARSFVMK